MTTEAEVIAGLRKELRDARRIISATHKNPVVHTNCEVHNCPICDGGLFQCADCGAAEIETETRVCSVALQAPQEAVLVRDLQLLLENYTAYAGDAVPASIIERSRELHARLSALSQPVATPAPSQDAAVVERARNELVIDAYRAMDAIDAIRRWCDGQAYENDTITVAKLRGFLPSLASTRPAEAQAVAEGLAKAIAFVRKRRDDYVTEHGSYDRETGTTEFPGNGDEYVGELEEIIEGLKALAASPATGGA